MGNGRFFNFDTLKYLKNGLVIEKFNYGLDIKKGIVNNSNGDYYIGRYLYKIEYLYLVNKFKTEDFIIYDIFYNNDGSKEILLRLLNDHKCVNVLIPPLIKSYSVKQNYVFKFCYLWKRPDGSVREFLSYHLIYNRNEHRNYVVGDVNKFGHELIKIYQRKFLISESKVCDYVGINLNF